jgi:RHS repeat-associated protein
MDQGFTLDSSNNVIPAGSLIWSPSDISQSASADSVTYSPGDPTTQALTVVPITGGTEYRGLNGYTDVTTSGNTLQMSYVPVDSSTPSSTITVTQSSPTQALVTETSNGQESGKFEITEPNGPNSYTILDEGTHICTAEVIGQSGSTPTLYVSNTYVTDSEEPDLVSSQYYTYQQFNWGVELTSVSNALGRTTTYVYDTDPGSNGYEQLKSIAMPDGQWTYFQYDFIPPDPLTGANPVVIRITPFNNAQMPTADPSDPSGFIENIEIFYDDNWRQETLTDGKMTALTEDVSSLGSDVEVQWSGTGSAYIANTTYSYSDQSAGNFIGQPYLVQDPTGRQTQYTYTQGDYNPSSHVFTSDSNGAAFLTSAIEGSATDPNGIPYETTRTDTVTDGSGHQVLQQTFVLTNDASYALMKTVISTYDALGNLVQTQRQMANQTSPVVTYSASYYGNLLISSTDEFGVVTTPIRAGRTQGQSLSDGVVTRVQTTTNDAAGRIVSQMDSSGLITSYSYANTNAGGARVTVTHPSRGTSVTDYNCDGRVASVYGSAEIPTAYSYSAPQDGVFSTTQTQGSGEAVRTTVTNTDMMGRTVTVTQPTFGGGNIISASNYDPVTGLLASVILGDGSLQPAMAYSYDELGRLQLQGLDEDGDGILSVSSTRDRITETDNSYQQDANGNWFTEVVTRHSSPSGMIATSTQMSRLDDLQTIVTGADGATTTQTLSVDRANQRVTVAQTSTAVSTPATSTYAGNTTLLSTQDARGGTTSYQYDQYGRVSQITDPLNRSTQISYVPAGQLGAGQEATRTFPDGSARISGYNLIGLLISSSGTAVYPTSYGYDGFGQMISLITQHRGGAQSTTTWQRDPGTGLVSFKGYADGHGTTYSYDAAQRLTQRTWARGIKTNYTYTNGDLTGISYSDGTPRVSFGNYQNNGLPGTITDLAGTRAVTYSNFGDVADENYSGSGLLTGLDVNRAYANAHRQSLTASVSGTTIVPTATYNFDSATFLLDGIQQGSLSVGYGYIPNSTLLSTVTTAQTGATLVRTLGYDAAGQLISAVNSVGSLTMSANGTQFSPMVYDQGGRRTQVPREDGSQWVYGYNSRGEVTSGGKQLGSGAPLLGYQFGYQFDDIGNRTQSTVNGRAANYVPNNLNQYTRRDVPGAVDISGSATLQATVTVNDEPTQRQGGFFYAQLNAHNASAPVLVSATTVGVRKGAGANGKDVVTQSSGKIFLAQTPEQYSYDADGNLTQDGRWTYTWDAENRLIAMQSIASVPAAAKQKLTFGYSAEGRRIAKSLFGWNTQTQSYALASETLFVYDGWNLIAEMNSADMPIRTYLWGQDVSGSLQGAGGVGGLVAMATTGANAGSYLYAYDANGNILGLADAEANSAATYEYGPFGEVVRSSGPMAGLNPFQFSTKYTDAETGFDYYGYRYYNPSTGRWLSRDPKKERAGLNLYGFVKNDGINRLDKLGLSTYSEIQAEANNLDNVLKSQTCCCDQKGTPTVTVSITGVADGASVTMTATPKLGPCVIKILRYYWWDCFSASMEYGIGSLNPFNTDWYYSGWNVGGSTYPMSETGSITPGIGDDNHWNFTAVALYTYCQGGHKHAALSKESDNWQWTWNDDPEDSLYGWFH